MAVAALLARRRHDRRAERSAARNAASRAAGTSRRASRRRLRRSANAERRARGRPDARAPTPRRPTDDSREDSRSREAVVVFVVSFAKASVSRRRVLRTGGDTRRRRRVVRTGAASSGSIRARQRLRDRRGFLCGARRRRDGGLCVAHAPEDRGQAPRRPLWRDGSGRPAARAARRRRRRARRRLERALQRARSATALVNSSRYSAQRRSTSSARSRRSASRASRARRRARAWAGAARTGFRAGVASSSGARRRARARRASPRGARPIRLRRRARGGGSTGSVRRAFGAAERDAPRTSANASRRG